VVAVLATTLVLERVARVVTICAPLHGTVLAPRLVPLRFVRGISRTHRRARAQAGTCKEINVVAQKDLLVIPYTSGLRAGAEHHVLRGVGHNRIIRDRRLHLLAQELVGQPSSPKR
jgi:hypothetical protein